MPWPVSSAQTLKPRALHLGLHGGADRADVGARGGGRQAAPQRRLRRGGQPLLARADAADRHGAAGVGVVAVELGGHVQLDQLALAQPARAGDAVHGLVVDGDADRAGEVVVQPRARARAVVGEDVARRRASSSAVVTPGRTRRASSRSVSATTRPAARSAASSSGWSIDTLSSSHIDVPGHFGRHCLQARHRLRLGAATCSSSPSTRSPTAATASRAATATSCSSPAPSPATACAPWSARPRRPTPRRARSSSSRAVARTASPPFADHPGAPVAGPALRAPARGQGRAGRGRADAGSAGSTATSSSRSCPPSSSGAIATSSSTRSARATTASSSAASTRPGAGTRSSPIDDCLLASERGNEAARAGAGVLPRARPPRLGPARPARLPAQPRRPRGSRRTGQLQVRLVTSPGKLDVDALIAAVDADGAVVDADRRASARAPRAARPRCSPAHPQLAEQLGGPATS